MQNEWKKSLWNNFKSYREMIFWHPVQLQEQPYIWMKDHVFKAIHGVKLILSKAVNLVLMAATNKRECHLHGCIQCHFFTCFTHFLILHIFGGFPEFFCFIPGFNSFYKSIYIFIIQLNIVLSIKFKINFYVMTYLCMLM